MTASFAALEARVNAAVFARLSNADATLGGVPVTGILDAGYDDQRLAGFGPAGSTPTFTLAASSVPARPEGLLLVVSAGPGAGTYRVGNAYPDATGLVALHLIA
jgi:hypothetical protein